MIELKKLSIGYGNKVLLDNANATVHKGTLCALIGVNGSGKSTLLRRIAGLSQDYQGEIYIDRNEVKGLKQSELSHCVSLVTTDRIRVNNITCREVVALGRAPYTNWIGKTSAKDDQIVDRAIELAKIGGFASRMISTLSDGEAQRVMIARAIAQDTPVILLDEPTSFLDLPSRYHLVELLKSLTAESGKTVIFSTHELEIAARSTDMTLIIDTPQIITAESSRIIPDGIIRQVFGIDLGHQ